MSTSICICSARSCQTTKSMLRLSRHALLRRPHIPSAIAARFSTAPNFRSGMEKEIEALPETKARTDLLHFLQTSAKTGLAYDTGLSTDNPFQHVPPDPPRHGYKHVMTSDQIRTTLDAAMATFHLHVESRIAALCGKGFYTIGPCGEEMLSAAGHALDPTVDAVALHYRHLGMSIVRQLRQGRTMEDILLDRARGYCVSKNDPVTGGVHCAIGSRVSEQDLRTGSGDYVVTSTLASQCPPAVGRALGFSVAYKLLPQSRAAEGGKSSRQVSFVTIGDGSMHNAHFLSAFNLARHARYRRIKCPVVFGISDNGMSISYKTDGYTRSLFNLRGDEIPMWSANGTDMLDVYDKTRQATEYSRKKAAPSLLLYKDITRRFGHAATDRQHAYLTEDEVLGMAESDVISSAIMQAVEQQNVGTYAEYLDRFEEIEMAASKAFDVASLEPKITDRDDMVSVVSQPMVPVPRLPEDKIIESADRKKKGGGKGGKAEVMRKHMTKVVAETLDRNPDVVYIGEDVEHGGYYLVTDGLAKAYPGRVIDFPPDETTLLGAAIGYSQAGLTPIIEIPYAKYLDCGVDTFYELAISNWLTNGQRPNGMVVRVQGFDRGVFGGNFHTHNMLSHVPPGVDALCFSNGQDYVRGFRNAIQQAKAGRVVMLIDCTNLLNLRHLHGRDKGWQTPYPPDEASEVMGFDDVRTYAGSDDGSRAKFAIVTYGNGVVTSLQARKAMIDKGQILESELDVIDCPYLSSVPQGLKDVLGEYDGVLFADICKEGPGSNALSPMISQLKKDDLLPENWDFVAAPRTYNPLGNMITFLNQEDIIDAFGRVVARGDESVARESTSSEMTG